MSVFKKYISNNEEESSPASAAQAPQTAPQRIEPPRQSQSAPQPQQQAAPAHAPQSHAAPASAPKPVASPPVTNGRNVLSSDVEIKGKVKFTNDLVVDGLIEGEIHSDGSLTVGENARIKAEVHTRSVVVYGKVHGNITVTDRVELKANAELIGDIKAATVSIEAGAIFVGKSTVGAPSTQVSSSANKSDKSDKNAKKNTDKKGKLATAS